MIQPSSFLNNYTEEAFKDFRTRVLLDSGFFESEEGSKPNFAYNLSTLTTNLDSDTQEFLKATGIKDNTTISHINNYVVKLKRFGLWSKMKALYPFVSDQRNVLRNTDTFSGWGLEGGTITGGFTDPLGGATAYRYTAVGTAGLWTSSPTMVISSSTKITYSFWIKSVSGNSMTAVLSDAYNVTPNYTINITGTWAYVTATLTLTSGNAGMYINVLSDPTNGFLIWRPQMEVGSVATTYQPTTAPSSIYTNHFKYNLKDPRDLDAAFRLTFSGGWQFSQLGATPNGINAYADTKLSPTTSLSTSSTHMSFYSRTNKNEGSYELAAAGHYSMILYQNSFYVNFDTSGSYPAQFSLSDTRGYYIGSRLNNTNVNGFRNGVKVINNIGLPSNLGTGTVKIGNGNGPYYSSKECGLVSIGEGLTDSEATNLYYLTEELQANLKRNVSPYNSFRGILDEYPGAAAAYSLRRLSGSYGGPLVKVRRSSDNTEQDIFPTASGSLDTTSLLSFVGANNGFVTTWYDQSGGGYNVTQATAGYQPQIVSSGTLQTILGKPTMLWDGIDDNLSQTLPVINGLSQIALISVTNPLGGALDNMKSSNLLFIETASWGNVGQVSTPSGLNYRIGTSQGANNNFYYASINVAIHATYKNGVNEVDRYNGVDILTSNTKLTTIANTSNILNIGKDEYLQSYSGKQSEVIIYFTDQTTNRYKLESNINTYYNVFWDGSRKGLLDFYPNAAAAYSVRALSSSYRGPLIKVRRASDNTERDIFALQNGNLDTFTLATFCSGTDGFVTTWYDQSGVGRNATQSDALKQPQAVINGVVTTDGVTNAIKFSDTGAQTLSFNAITNIRSVFHVHKLNTITSGLNIFFLGSSGFYDYHGANEYYLASSYASLDVLNGVNKRNGVVTNLSTVFYNLNRNFISLIHTASTGRANTISADRTENNRSWKGFISEIVLYSSDQTSNRLAIESNINTYYTIY